MKKIVQKHLDLFITLGNDKKLGGKLLLVIIRGLKNKWKQVI